MLSEVILKNKKDYNTKQVRRYLQAVFVRIFMLIYMGQSCRGEFTTTLMGLQNVLNAPFSVSLTPT